MACMKKIIFVLIVFLLFIWRIKKGFYNGMMKEIGTILSGAVSLASVALILFAISSYIAKTMSTLTLCIAGLIVLGAVFKICSLIFRPILALGNFSVIGGFNKIMGAVMGAAEAAILSYLIYYLLDRAGIYVL